MKKKILIFYGAYGGGHLSAAKAIKNYLDNHYEDCETLMIDCVEYINKYINKLSTTAYKEMAKKAPWMWKRIYSNSDHGALAKITTTSNKLMARKLNNILQEFEPDLVISTHPFGVQMTTYLKSKGKWTYVIGIPVTIILLIINFIFLLKSFIKKVN